MEARITRRWMAGILGAMVLGALLVSGAVAGIKTSKPVKVGFDPTSVAVGDFNKDGKDDLAVSNFGSSAPPGTDDTISILAGKGNGKFKVVKTLKTTSQPDGVVVGRVGPGAEPDLIVAGSSVSELMIWEGKGGFGFKPVRELALPGTPRELATDDFDGDRKRDLAVSRQGTNDIAVLLQRKKGKFEPPASYPGGFGAEVMAVRLDKDKFPDLVTVKPDDGEVLVMAGSKKGKFKAPHKYEVPKGTSHITYSDFNQDHIEDLALTGFAFPDSGKAKVSVMNGKRGGNFEKPHTISLGKLAKFHPTSITAAQLDGDHDPDLVVGGDVPGTSGALMVLSGEHKSGFSKPRRIKQKGAINDAVAVRYGPLDKVPFLIESFQKKGSVGVLGR